MAKNIMLMFLKFIERIGKFELNVDACIYNYSETSTGNDNLQSVAEMAGIIQNYVTQVEEKITLHVDFSGGMRNVDMIMLDIIRLLEYSGIKFDKLLYLNLNNATQTANITGVEEFMNFGTVEASNKYYSDKFNLSAQLKNLIKARDNFSEAVKLCHYGQFRAAIDQLHDAVRDFKPDTNNVQDVLMGRLIEHSLTKRFES